MQNIYELIPEATSGNFHIRKRSRDRFMDLMAGSVCYMSNKPEMLKSYEVLNELTGNVLICGLGLGYAVLLCIDNPKITHVDVVEKERDIINLVGPYVGHEKVTIIEDDIYRYLDSCESKYDSIFYDCFYQDDEKEKQHLVAATKAKWSDSNIVLWV